MFISVYFITGSPVLCHDAVEEIRVPGRRLRKEASLHRTTEDGSHQAEQGQSKFPSNRLALLNMALLPSSSPRETEGT